MLYVDKPNKEDFNKSVIKSNAINNENDIDTTYLDTLYRAVKRRNAKNEENIKTFLCRLAILDMLDEAMDTTTGPDPDAH